MNLLLTIAAVANPVLTALLTILVFLESKKSKNVDPEKTTKSAVPSSKIQVFPKFLLPALGAKNAPKMIPKMAPKTGPEPPK